MTEHNISFEYYFFKFSGKLMKLFYTIDSYIQIRNVINFIINPISLCKKQKDFSILYNSEKSNIYINKVYFRNISPLRKEISKKQLIFGINNKNIQNIWKIYKKEFKEKPKIGDFIEVHYNVPCEKINKNITYTSYIVTYVYPCNIQFPPYSVEELIFYDKNSNYKNGVLFAYCNDEDFTNKAIKLAGPMGNFYSDLPLKYGIRVTRKILITDDKNKEELVITDNNGDEIKVINNNIIKL
jgi:hypothetical protein